MPAEESDQCRPDVYCYMRGNARGVGRGGTGWWILLVAVAAATACSSPAAPTPTPTPTSTPTPTPTPTPSPVPLQMSGRVLDENGAPIANALVEVDYSSGGGTSRPPSQCPSFAQFCWFALRTNQSGEYSAEFTPRPWPGRGLGYVYSFSDGYEVDVQWVPVGPNPAVRDMHLRPSRKILAGDSTFVSVAPTSSLCTDLEDLWSLENRCEIVIVESGPGILDFEARPASAGPFPSIFWYTTGNYAGFITRPGPGKVSIPVRGGTYRILVALPEGAATQQFTVTTSLR